MKFLSYLKKKFPFHYDSEEYLIARWGMGIIPIYYTRRRMMPAEGKDGASLHKCIAWLNIILGRR